MCSPGLFEPEEAHKYLAPTWCCGRWWTLKSEFHQGDHDFDHDDDGDGDDYEGGDSDEDEDDLARITD